MELSTVDTSRYATLIDLQNELFAHDANLSGWTAPQFDTNCKHVETLLHYLMTNFECPTTFIPNRSINTLDIETLMQLGDGDVTFAVLHKIIKNKTKFTVDKVPSFVDYATKIANTIKLF